jgi:hypothetical protein
MESCGRQIARPTLMRFDAASGQPLAHGPLSMDAGGPVTNLTSAGVAIAEHDVLVAAGGISYSAAMG